MRFLGVLFLALLLSATTVIVDIFVSGNFLSRFIDNSFIETFASLIGFNLASVTFLLGQLITIEATVNNDSMFDNTRKEIRHNTYFLIATFILSLLLLVFRPEFEATGLIRQNVWYYIFNTSVLTIFLMSLFAIYEILKSVFAVGKFFKKNI